MTAAIDQLRDATFEAAHAQLDAMLNGPATFPDGTVGTVLDDICIRQLHGCGFTVSISVVPPPPEPTQPPPLQLVP